MNWQNSGWGAATVFFLVGLLILLSSLFLRRELRRRALIGILVVAGVAAGLFGVYPGTGVELQSSPTFSLLQVAFPPLLDSLSGGWLLISSLLVCTILLWPRRSGAPAGTFRCEAGGGFLLVSVTQLMLLTTNVWVQWACWAWSGWLLCLILSRDVSNGERGRAAAACLVWFTIADFLWMIGLISLNMVIAEVQISEITDASVFSQLSGGEAAVCISGISLMVAALMLRCCMYPLMSWMSPVVSSYRDAAWVVGFGFGPALMLLFRWQTVFNAFFEIRLLQAGAGLLSAAVLGLIAWGHVRSPRRLVYVVASQIGLIWLGAGADGGLTASFVLLAMLLIWLSSILALGIDQLEVQSAGTMTGRFLLFLLILLLTSGVAGQELLFDAVRRSTQLGVLNPWILLTGALLAHAVFCLMLFRSIEFGNSTQPAESTQMLAVGTREMGAAGWILLFVLSFAGAIGLAGLSWKLADGALFWMPIPILSGLIMLIALIAARTWPEGFTRPVASNDSRESLRRLAVSEVYIPMLIAFTIVLPIRAAAQISRLLEWILIGNLTHKLPATLLGGIASRAALVDEETGEIDRMWQLLSTTAVMLAGVAIGAVMTLRHLW